MQRDCFDIRLFHVLGTTGMFEWARVDQAFTALASKVKADFFLHTRWEGVRMWAIGFGDLSKRK